MARLDSSTGQNRKEWEQKGKEIVANMVQQYKDVYGHQKMVQLDGIQDVDGSALRSELLSNESQRTSRNTAEYLDSDNMSNDTGQSITSMATRLVDGARSQDGSTATIFEDLEEDFDEDDKDTEEDSDREENSDDDSSDGEAEVEEDRSGLRDSFYQEEEDKTSGTTIDVSKRTWDQETQRDQVHKELPTKRDPEEVPAKRDEAPKEVPTKRYVVPKEFTTSSSKASVASSNGSSSKKGGSESSATAGANIKAGRSDTTCSATQIISEWDQESIDSFYQPDVADSVESMDVYVNLHQRITKRLVGSITNTRAYDTQPSFAEMSFM